MLFDLSKATDRQCFKRKVNEFYESQKLVELKTKTQRTPKQNRYLFLILGWYGIETGNDVEYVKEKYFKRLCNPDIFLTVKNDKYLGNVEIIRSTKDCTTAELTTAIDKFRNWSSKECGIYLPEPNEQAFLQEIEIEMSKYKEWL